MDRTEKVVAWLVALGYPCRIDLILALADGERTSGVLAVEVGVTPCGASHHLKGLRRAGFVATTRVKHRAWHCLVGATVTPATVELVHPSGAWITLDRPFPPAGTKGPKK